MAAEDRRQRRKQQMTAAILEAAEHAFAAHGFESVAIEQVAEAADVAVGSIYNRFGSKEGLLLAVAEHALETDERYMDAAYDPSLSPIQQISAAAAWYFQFSRDHPELFRLLAFPLRPPRPIDGPAAEIARRVAQRVGAQNARLAGAIRAGVDSGVLRPVPPEDAAVFLWAAWSGVIALAWRPDSLGRSADDVEQLLALGATLIGTGLVADP